MFRAVILGFSHMHVNEIAMYLDEQPDFELVGIAEVPSEAETIPPLRYTPFWNLNNVKEKYCDNVYEDYTQMLDELKPDIAFILSENCQKPAIVEECAKRGVNVCIEKPLAVSLEEAKKIQESVDKYGIEAVVNWPVIWTKHILKMMALVKSGIVGKPIRMRYLNGHTGPLGIGAKHRGVTESAEEMTDELRGKTWWHQKKFGGGVLLDICGYGCLLTRWAMGADAKSAQASASTLNTAFGDTADNTAALISYEDKLSVIEATWTMPRALVPAGPVILCTEGVIACTGLVEGTPDVQVYDMYGKELPMPELEFGDDYKNLPWHYAHAKKTGAPMEEITSLKANMEVMAILDAVIRSAESEKAEAIHE